MRVVKMDKAKLHDEALKRATELQEQGDLEQAAEFARNAVRLAHEIGVPPGDSPAEMVLELIENDLRVEETASTADISELLQGLGGDDWPQAIQALEKVGEPAVLPLCDLVIDSGAKVRQRGLAAAALGNIADSRAIDALLVLLQDPDLLSDKYAAKNAIFAFEHFRDPRVTEALKPFLGNEDLVIREAAEVVLEKHGVPVPDEAVLSPGPVTSETPTEPAPRAPPKGFTFPEQCCMCLGEVETARTISQLQADHQVLEVEVPMCRQCEERVPYPNARKLMLFSAAFVFLGLFLFLLDVYFLNAGGLLVGVQVVLVLGGLAVMVVGPPIIWYSVGPAFIVSARSGSHYYVRRIRFKNPQYQVLFDEANPGSRS